MLSSNLNNSRLKNDSFTLKIEKDCGHNREKVVRFASVLVTGWDQVFLEYFDGADFESD